MNPNKIFFLNELPRSKVKNDKKGEEALRSNPLSVDKKWAPWPVAVVGGKDATEMNSQYDVFDFVFLSFRAHSAFALRQKHSHHHQYHHSHHDPELGPMRPQYFARGMS